MRLSILSLLIGVMGCQQLPAAPATAPPVPFSELRTQPFIAGPEKGPFSSVEELERGHLDDKPLVVVFFATWCDLCAHKVRAVKRAMNEVEGAKVVFVAVDDDDTKPHVPGFLREQRMPDAPVIDGLAHPEILTRYNPESSIPLVLVVDTNGNLIDRQIGLRSGDGERLEESLRAANGSAPARLPRSAALSREPR